MNFDERENILNKIVRRFVISRKQELIIAHYIRLKEQLLDAQHSPDTVNNRIESIRLEQFELESKSKGFIVEVYIAVLFGLFVNKLSNLDVSFSFSFVNVVYVVPMIILSVGFFAFESLRFNSGRESEKKLLFLKILIILCSIFISSTMIEYCYTLEYSNNIKELSKFNFFDLQFNPSVVNYSSLTNGWHIFLALLFITHTVGWFFVLKAKYDEALAFGGIVSSTYGAIRNGNIADL